MKTKNHLRTCLIMISLIYFNTSYGFWFWNVVYDPSDVVQNTISAKNSVQSLINQGKQLEYEFKNVQKLAGRFDNKTVKLLEQWSLAGQKGNSLSYSVTNLETVFAQKFPGFGEKNNYLEQFMDRSNAVKETLASTMKGLTLQGQAFSQENDDINELQDLSSKSAGNLEAQQVSHRIQLQQITQMQKLRQLLLNQASSQQAYMAYQIQKDQSTQSAFHSWLSNSQIPFKEYDDQKGFGANDLPST